MAITFATVGIPTWVLDYLNFSAIAGLVGVTTLGALIATAKAGTRAGLVYTFGVSAFMALAILTAANVFLATLTMALAALALGLSALRGWQPAMVLAPIVTGFIIAQPPPIKFSRFDDAFTFAYGSFFFALIAVLLVTWLAGSKGQGQGHSYGQVQGHSHGRGHSHSDLKPITRPRTIGYAIMLVGVTLVTTPIALLTDWGHVGGWLIMTPFIVLQPYQRDGVRKGLARLGGTVAGFIVVALVAQVSDSRTLLGWVGVVFAMAAMWALSNNWNYAIYAFLLTPAIVVLEGLHSSVETTALDRVSATALGVGVAMFFIVVLEPLYHRATRATLTQ